MKCNQKPSETVVYIFINWLADRAIISVLRIKFIWSRIFSFNLVLSEYEILFKARHILDRLLIRLYNSRGLFIYRISKRDIQNSKVIIILRRDFRTVRSFENLKRFVWIRKLAIPPQFTCIRYFFITTEISHAQFYVSDLKIDSLT